MARPVRPLWLLPPRSAGFLSLLDGLQPHKCLFSLTYARSSRVFTWQIFDNYLLCLASLEARFGEGAPVGYQVCVHGGEPELHQGSTHLRVSFGTMLWVEYAPCTDPDSAGHS